MSNRPETEEEARIITEMAKAIARAHGLANYEINPDHWTHWQEAALKQYRAHQAMRQAQSRISWAGKGHDENKKHSVTVSFTISERGDGGIQIVGDDSCLGLLLSGKHDAVLADLGPVLAVILSHNYGVEWLKKQESE